MTPPRRNLISRAVGIIRDASNAEAFDVPATKAALIGLGAMFIEGNTNTIKLSGVTASCTWDAGEALILRWAANARTALAEGTDETATPSSDEEE